MRLRPAAVAALILATGVAAAAEPTVEFGRFGTVHLYEPTAAPTELVLFISGDGGWNEGVVDMARHLRDRGALVAGIDVTAWGRQLRASADSCIFTAGDLEDLAHDIELRYRFPEYVRPLLAGYSSGATLAYASLVQSPAGTFKGALSLGFCPELPWEKPLCRGDGPGLESLPAAPRGFAVKPSRALQDPWIVLQGAVDQVCDAGAARQFAAHVPAATFIELPKVGHGFSVERNYLDRYFSAYARLAQQATPALPATGADVAGLPLVEVPARGRPRTEIAVMLSGDGGWAGLDRGLADEFAAQGIAVVGWDSLRYFWKKRTPADAAADLDRVLRHYLTTWRRSRAILVGYSLGAAAMPFMQARLPAATRARVALTALIAPGPQAFFEFHVTDWLASRDDGLPLAPEIRRLGDARVLCLYGADEADSACPALRGPAVRSLRLPGGHHFDGDYAGLARSILADLPPAP